MSAAEETPSEAASPSHRRGRHVTPREPAQRTREHWILLVGSLLALALFLVLGHLVHPDARGFGTHEQLWLPSCKMMEWTGVPCPGCGVTTSVAFAARGDVLDSLRTQPFGLVVAVTLLFLPVWAFVGHFRGRDLYRSLQSWRMGRLGAALAVLLAAAWIYKLVVVLGPHV